MSNPYQPDPYGGYGQAGGPPGPPPQQQPYGYPQAPQPPQQPGYGYPQQPHPSHPYPPNVPMAVSNNHATTSVVLGFIAILLSCVYGGVVGLVGVGLGVSGLNQSAQLGGTGRTAAIGGIVLGALSVLLTIGFIVLQSRS
ncbi:hypothetical protein ACIHEI_15075 [Kitasatospora sp. NPDC051984]|uniref:hypothetical protein n=1 Tax=Kitasatospora sp. NPDC051984 TaxID=3364059 RepID=UPI0037C887A0